MADLEPADGAQVHGSLVALSPSQAARLDSFERGYRRIRVAALLHDGAGSTVQAEAYQMERTADGHMAFSLPSEAYLCAIWANLHEQFPARPAAAPRIASQRPSQAARSALGAPRRAPQLARRRAHRRTAACVVPQGGDGLDGGDGIALRGRDGALRGVWSHPGAERLQSLEALLYEAALRLPPPLAWQLPTRVAGEAARLRALGLERPPELLAALLQDPRGAAAVGLGPEAAAALLGLLTVSG